MAYEGLMMGLGAAAHAVGSSLEDLRMRREEDRRTSNQARQRIGEMSFAEMLRQMDPAEQERLGLAKAQRGKAELELSGLQEREDALTPDDRRNMATAPARAVAVDEGNLAARQREIEARTTALGQEERRLTAEEQHAQNLRDWYSVQPGYLAQGEWRKWIDDGVRVYHLSMKDEGGEYKMERDSLMKYLEDPAKYAHLAPDGFRERSPLDMGPQPAGVGAPYPGIGTPLRPEPGAATSAKPAPLPSTLGAVPPGVGAPAAGAPALADTPRTPQAEGPPRGVTASASFREGAPAQVAAPGGGGMDPRVTPALRKVMQHWGLDPTKPQDVATAIARADSLLGKGKASPVPATASASTAGRPPAPAPAAGAPAQVGAPELTDTPRTPQAEGPPRGVTASASFREGAPAATPKRTPPTDEAKDIAERMTSLIAAAVKGTSARWNTLPAETAQQIIEAVGSAEEAEQLIAEAIAAGNRTPSSIFDFVMERIKPSGGPARSAQATGAPADPRRQMEERQARDQRSQEQLQTILGAPRRK